MGYGGWGWEVLKKALIINFVRTSAPVPPAPVADSSTPAPPSSAPPPLPLYRVASSLTYWNVKRSGDDASKCHGQQGEADRQHCHRGIHCQTASASSASPSSLRSRPPLPLDLLPFHSPSGAVTSPAAILPRKYRYDCCVRESSAQGAFSAYHW